MRAKTTTGLAGFVPLNVGGSLTSCRANSWANRFYLITGLTRLLGIISGGECHIAAMLKN
jgi:hypothetical protein